MKKEERKFSKHMQKNYFTKNNIWCTFYGWNDSKTFEEKRMIIHSLKHLDGKLLFSFP